MRTALKRAIASARSRRPGEGATILIYHRVGEGRDELGVSQEDFVQQADCLASHHVVSLDTALDGLAAGQRGARVVLTFDDGFGDVYHLAWPVLRERGLPFTIYLATAYVGGLMRWSGSTAKDPAAPALTWVQLEEMVASGLCTVGSHTHSHVRPEDLTEEELSRCDDAIHERLGIASRHFAYPWGIPVPAMEQELRKRYRSAVTGSLGRNLPGVNPMLLARVPVRRTDPLEFFKAKLTGSLVPERLYGAAVAGAKGVGIRA